MHKVITSAVAAALGIAVLAGCGASHPSSVQNDQANTNSQLDRYQRNQPVPAFNWSAYRQTVIDVETAEVTGVATTSFFYNQGVKAPVFTCPSIGFPVAVTAQLTNPQQVVGGGGTTNEGVPVGQAEPNGVYTGDSSGTYVTCVTPAGAKFYKYWEGFVGTDGGPAHWDGNAEVLDGAPTVKVTSK